MKETYNIDTSNWLIKSNRTSNKLYARHIGNHIYISPNHKICQMVYDAWESRRIVFLPRVVLANAETNSVSIGSRLSKINIVSKLQFILKPFRFLMWPISKMTSSLGCILKFCFEVLYNWWSKSKAGLWLKHLINRVSNRP